MSMVFLVLGMAAVTYIPRMLPMVLLQDIQMPPFLNRFLGFIPFAALGALIFPGIIYSTGDGDYGPAIAGMSVSVIVAFFRVNVMFVVLGGIAAAFGWKMMGL
ncbi:AzlD domain-containing protein [Aneurinibacillus sp. Ricciae_BoGa-3]|uniref:AzlD domain-containing protein n=1 Tax=Aneurinibacillus sp. Ricciae_BoGa-3 TaxID=3022697 RepID=UPI00234221AA|nr:AzlD domain-containing protein [Aneurinibacillus sp. Ricciae_BoGa-3]WCK55808.1 AzlD domain-containing protein [Aneurinibacillus sp. Ricciae_BoGa-3]